MLNFIHRWLFSTNHKDIGSFYSKIMVGVILLTFTVMPIVFVSFTFLYAINEIIAPGISLKTSELIPHIYTFILQYINGMLKLYKALNVEDKLLSFVLPVENINIFYVYMPEDSVRDVLRFWRLFVIDMENRGTTTDIAIYVLKSLDFPFVGIVCGVGFFMALRAGLHFIFMQIPLTVMFLYVSLPYPVLYSEEEVELYRFITKEFKKLYENELVFDDILLYEINIIVFFSFAILSVTSLLLYIKYKSNQLALEIKKAKPYPNAYITKLLFTITYLAVVLFLLNIISLLRYLLII